jgi:hypothetical protein
MVKLLTHVQLDERLERLAAEPERFAQACLELAAEFDRDNIALEIADPLSWRRPVETAGQAARVTLAQQFRAEVDSITIMDRESEARLARRIEFARVRFEKVLADTGVSPDLVPKSVGHVSFGVQGVSSSAASCRRASAAAGSSCTRCAPSWSSATCTSC